MDNHASLPQKWSHLGFMPVGGYLFLLPGPVASTFSSATTGCWCHLQKQHQTPSREAGPAGSAHALAAQLIGTHMRRASRASFPARSLLLLQMMALVSRNRRDKRLQEQARRTRQAEGTCEEGRWAIPVCQSKAKHQVEKVWHFIWLWQNRTPKLGHDSEPQISPVCQFFWFIVQLCAHF